MTDSTAEPADFSGILAARSVAEEAQRQRNIRRGIAAAAVVVLHILALIGFMTSNRVAVVERVRATVPEAIWILMPRPHPPKPRIEAPVVPDVGLPILIEPPTAPINLPVVPRRPLAPPASGGILGVGRSLACGASSYENLTAAQREDCIRHPWHMVKRPDGTIVLEAPPKPVEPPPSAADIMRHEQQTAPPCPILNNVPCLGRVMHGDPLGGGPQPF